MLKLCLGAQSRWTEQARGGISQHLLGYESEQTRHHHVAFLSQGHACHLSDLHCCVPSRKRSHSSVLCLPLPQVCSGTLNRPVSLSSCCKCKRQCGNGGPLALLRHWKRSWRGCYQPSATWRVARAFLPGRS